MEELEDEDEDIDGDESIFRMSLKLLLSSSGKIVTRSEEENVLLASSSLASLAVTFILDDSLTFVNGFFVPLKFELLPLFGM